MKNLSHNDSIVRFAPELTHGLGDKQVFTRKNQGLINKTQKKYSKSIWNIFVDNVFTFFNLLGLIVFIALLYIKAAPSNFFFVFFYVANTLIGIVQEIRAKMCIDKLLLITSKSTKIIRNSQTINVTNDEIVLDDLILLEVGNQIPTDCIVREGVVEVNESLITGESIPIKKNIGDLLLAGSFIISGACTAQAEKVGAENYVEKLTKQAKQYKKPQSEIMISLKKIITFISFAIFPLAIFHLLKSTLFYDRTIQDAILHTSPIVIGMIPAGMFLLTSVALAVGVVKLAKKNTLVQDLYSLEMLARVDTICFDKTGTITDGNMTVNRVVPIKEINLDVNVVLGSMLLALNDSNQTALALNEYFGKNETYKPKTILPFSSKRKLSAVTFNDIGTFCFGAPEFVLDQTTYVSIQKEVEKYASIGYRVLVVAHSNAEITDNQSINDYTPICLILIADNIRKEAIETIKWFKNNNVQVKVISGDNPITVSEVSKRAGIENAEKYVSLDGKTDEEVYNSANEYTVFGRVSPEQKAILIKSMKDNDHVTAMTGDGVNDILALKEANCAISVATGSEAARNVSNLVLLDNNFNSMPSVVHEGRRVINNVQSSSSLFFMKTLFTMIVSLIILFIPWIETYPFELPQMIMLEIFVIGIPAFLLSLQPNDSIVEGRFITHIFRNSLPSSLLMVINVVIIQIIQKLPYFASSVFADDVYVTMSVYALTISGLITLAHICNPFNKYRTILFIGSTLFVGIIIFIGMCFGFEPLRLTKMLPISKYWLQLLILVVLIVLDPLILFALEKITSKIKVLSN